MRSRGFVFGDIHFPFQHRVILALAMYVCIKKRPDYVVQIGDLHDKYSSAKFPRSYNLFTPKQEREWSNYYAELFWMTLRKHLPRAKFYQILGNHCVRPVKRIMEKAPEFEEEMVEALNEDYTFDTVKTIYDHREELLIDDVLFHHGYLSKLGAHHEFTHTNFVAGHSHTGGTVFRPLKGHLTTQTWEANAGYLADPFSRGLSYTAVKKATRWTHGYLEIDPRGPRFCPLHPGIAELPEIKDDPIFKDLLSWYK